MIFRPLSRSHSKQPKIPKILWSPKLFGNKNGPGILTRNLKYENELGWSYGLQHWLNKMVSDLVGDGGWYLFAGGCIGLVSRYPRTSAKLSQVSQTSWSYCSRNGDGLAKERAKGWLEGFVRVREGFRGLSIGIADLSLVNMMCFDLVRTGVAYFLGIKGWLILSAWRAEWNIYFRNIHSFMTLMSTILSCEVETCSP